MRGLSRDARQHYSVVETSSHWFLVYLFFHPRDWSDSFFDTIDGDGVIYFPSLTAGNVPTNPNDRHVTYQLVDILASGGMWDQRANPSLFASFGSFAGDTTGGCGSGAIACTANSANTPWAWDDHDDKPARGALATDPAGLVKAYFTIPEAVSATYTFNPFQQP